MLGFQIDEPTFPSPLDPISFVAPSPSTQSAYINQKGESFNGSSLNHNQRAFQSMDYSANPSFDTHNGDFSICKLPSNSSQNDGCRGDKVCRIKLEQEVMDTDFRGLSMRRDNGGGSKEYVGDYGEALLASMKENYVGGLKRTVGSDINFVGDVQAFCMASSVRRDSSLFRFLPSNNEELAMDVSSCDEFRMYEFKVRRCMKGRSHDWTECPFAHAGEKARRRDPRRFHYSGTACPNFRRGNCKSGDSCELSHGVFECWLHPARYRTQLCKDGKSCKRRVCFFAHSPSQLRLVSPETAPRSRSIFKSPFSNFSDTNQKHPQYPVSLSNVALSDGYGGEGFLDDFSPKSMHSFPDDRFVDAFYPIICDGHSLSNSQRPSNDVGFDSYGPKRCYGNGLCDNSHGKSHSYLPPFVDDGNFTWQNSPVHADSVNHNPPIVGISFDGFPHDQLTFKNNQAHVNLRTQLALASLSSKFEHIMSPKSTLVRHVFSPPALSPSLSPSDSPPMSPSMVFPGGNAVGRKMASSLCCGQRDALSTAMDIHHSNFNGTLACNASLLANLAQNNGTAMFATNTCGPSPLSVGDHANDADMLTAMRPRPTHVEELGLEPGIEGEAQSIQAISHLFSGYQKLKNRRPAHPLNGLIESRWDADQGPYWVAPIQRADLGQGLTARIYGNLGKEEVSDAENPDFGWVNDLVT